MQTKYHAWDATVPVGTVLKETAISEALYVPHFGATWGPFNDGRTYDEGMFYPDGYRSKEVRGNGTLDSHYCKLIVESNGYPAKRLNGEIFYKKDDKWVRLS